MIGYDLIVSRMSCTKKVTTDYKTSIQKIGIGYKNMMDRSLCKTKEGKNVK